MTSASKSAAELREAASDDSATAARFYRMAEAYSGDVSEQMRLLGTLHEKRSELNNEMAARFEAIVNRARKTS